MIQKIKNALKRRKVKIFFVFLLCATLIWFINNLSETYMGNVVFNLKFENVPQDYLFKEASRDTVNVKLRASGFQFLRLNIANKQVKINLSELNHNGPIFYAPPNVYRRQIEEQFPGSMALMEIDKDTLYFELLPILTKKIPVRPRVEMNLAKNYLIDGNMVISPDSVTIKGPAEEIDSIKFASTETILLPDLDADFSKDVEIIKSDELKNTEFAVSRINVKGEIARFSEKLFKLSIKKINFPKGVEAVTFPEQVSVLCKAQLSRLKELKNDDFQVIADYALVQGGESPKIPLKLSKKPEGIQNAKLVEKDVEFILKRK